MLAHELINDEIPPLKLTDTGEKAIRWMDEFKVSHLPVIDSGKFLGLLAEADLLDQDQPEEPISDFSERFIQNFVRDDEHVFEVVKAISDGNLSVIPILNSSDQYLGCVSITHLMNVIAEMPVVEAPGGIIIMEMHINDYVLSEIARIVENNNARILGCLITAHPDSAKIEVTLKINKTELGAILQTFNRYNYQITASYDQNEKNTDLKDRYDLLMNYLNMK